MDLLARIGNVSLLLLFAVSGLSGDENSEEKKYSFRQPAMGTLFQLTLYSDDQITANRAAKAGFDRIRALDASLSDYKPDSELNVLCRSSGKNQLTTVSDDLWSVLEFSKSLSIETNGAFDVTIGPLVKLWRSARKDGLIPQPSALASAKESVGSSLLILEGEDQKVTLKEPNMQLDLGGIAKGYALDAALKAINTQFKITRVLIDGGGDVIAGDPPPGRDHWNVAVRNPDSKDEPWIVPLKNAALATSGDLHQFVEIDGSRYSHIVDPSTAMGLTHQLQVSVIAPTGMAADAFASAVSVLGHETGLELLAKKDRCEGFVIFSGDGKTQSVLSPGFPRTAFVPEQRE